VRAIDAARTKGDAHALSELEGQFADVGVIQLRIFRFRIADWPAINPKSAIRNDAPSWSTPSKSSLKSRTGVASMGGGRRGFWQGMNRLGPDRSSHAADESTVGSTFHRRKMPMAGLDPAFTRAEDRSTLRSSLQPRGLAAIPDPIHPLGETNSSRDLVVITGDLITGGLPIRAIASRRFSRTSKPNTASSAPLEITTTASTAKSPSR